MSVYNPEDIRVTEFDVTSSLEELKQQYEDQGLDTTNWHAGSYGQIQLQAYAQQYTDLLNSVRLMINSMLNEYSSGSMLTLLSDSAFDNQRTLEEKAVGKVILSASALLPKTYNPGKLIIVNNGTLQYENLDQIQLTSLDPVFTGSFRALEAGSIFNIPSNSVFTTSTTELGLNISNPPIAGQEDWLTIRGRDRESDDVLRLRNKTKTSQFGIGLPTTERILNQVLSASENVYYANAVPNPRGAFTLDVYISNQTTTSSTGDLNAVQNALDNLSFGGNSDPNSATYHYFSASLATPVTFSSSIDIYYRRGFNINTIQNQVEAQVNAWIAGIKIAGNSYAPVTSLSGIARINDLIARLEQINGVETTTITPNTDLTFASNEKLVKPSSYSNLISYTQLT